MLYHTVTNTITDSKQPVRENQPVLENHKLRISFYLLIIRKNPAHSWRLDTQQIVKKIKQVINNDEIEHKKFILDWMRFFFSSFLLL
jgi:hypothetical protein